MQAAEDGHMHSQVQWLHVFLVMLYLLARRYWYSYFPSITLLIENALHDFRKSCQGDGECQHRVIEMQGLRQP